MVTYELKYITSDITPQPEKVNVLILVWRLKKIVNVLKVREKINQTLIKIVSILWKAQNNSKTNLKQQHLT